MHTILQFLRDLEANNNHEWFDANRSRYDDAMLRWKSFCSEMVAEIGQFDRRIACLSPREYSYRIYRDVHISQDPTTYFDLFLAPGGKRSLRAGYYFMLGTGSGESRSHLSARNYYRDPDTIKLLREDIAYGWDEFSTEVLTKAAPGFYPENLRMLKRVPSGFDPEAPYADWLRCQIYSVRMDLDDHFVTQPQLPQRLAALYCTVQPFADYVNRAVAYKNEKY